MPDTLAAQLLEQIMPRADRAFQRKMKIKNSQSLVGPAEMIGEGDCTNMGNLISYTEADDAFHHLKRTVQWQHMFHRSGEVPRLVAVQGAVDTDRGLEPIYRHPADESPAMLPFDDTVDTLRHAAEKHIGHPLNHVLIQYYRSGEDNISEHSDKTLDIVRGSHIVNVSLGAQRIMTIRTKKDADPSFAGDDPAPPHDAPTRKTQRIPLMHGAMFVLGPQTNQFWLHSVRPDKRRDAEKAPEELAYGGERISLTFRHIGTFLDKERNCIWGQGATAKAAEHAVPLLRGDEAEAEGEKMIRAFGMENQLATNWSWDEWYGKGFDVVNFETRLV
jgi:alkylated DNA repair dioxygenase AlkB